jgi:hypothetical protein
MSTRSPEVEADVPERHHLSHYLLAIGLAVMAISHRASHRTATRSS